jgi:hypothetical protein
MGPLDALWHLGGFFAMAFLAGSIVAVLAKAMWRRELTTVPLWQLAAYTTGAGCIVTLAGLLISGRDGRMVTYAAMVLANALTLWWRGFGPGRSEPRAR